MEAAFFDLDKTVIARASIVAFAPTLRRAGLLSRGIVVRALVGQIIYMHFGANEKRLAKVRSTALSLTQGWEQAKVAALVKSTLEEVIEPIIYAEALELIRMHREHGRLVVIVSASPEEIVAPLAEYLGADLAIATKAKIDEHGRYSGDLEHYAYGPGKAVAMRELAEERDLDLQASHAYSDSISDVPMLECVGHPVAVNPDRALLQHAKQHGWEVAHFVRPVRVRLRPTSPGRATITSAIGITTLVIVVFVLWWSRRMPGSPPNYRPTHEGF
ncbi:MAG: HAD family hydrolase [Acidimicrobiales bacterium]